ncbi:MAG: DEAD/DEAH box helicase, partial [Nocardioidaceae bacterium]
MATNITWESRLATVANRHASKIEKAFGHRTVGDLLQHYPRRYVARDKLSRIDRLNEGEIVTVLARIRAAESKEYPDRRTRRPAYRLEVLLETEGADLLLTFFDKARHTAHWRRGRMRPGATGLFSGKVGRFRDRWQLTNPDTLLFDEDQDGDAAEAFDKLPKLVPIYPAAATVHSWQLARVVAAALDLVDHVPDVLPDGVRREHDLLTARQALAWIHRADDTAQLEAARARLRFDEAFVTQTVLAQRRASLAGRPAQQRTGRVGGLLDRFDERLPFVLTAGQQRVGADILADLALPHPMHRLLEGEVGSGKTVVALRAMLRVIDSGGQAALLAPTEVLAAQH